MAAFLFLVLTFAPLMAPPLVVCTAVGLVVRTRRRPRVGGRHALDAGSWALVAVMAGASALGAYAYGVMSGFYILDPDQMCAARGAAGDHVVTRTSLPVSAQCVTSQGVGTELVPGWVNPVVVIGLAACAFAVGAGIFAGVRGLRAPDTAGPGDPAGSAPAGR